MDEPDKLKLILKSKTFDIPSDFPSLSDVKPEIYNILKTKKRYFVKSDVRRSILRSFINNWLNKEVPIIHFSNLSEYIQLSDEFDRMKDLVGIFRKNMPNNDNSVLLIRKNNFKEDLVSNHGHLKKIKNKHQQIIHSLFTNTGINTHFEYIKIKDDLLRLCLKNDTKLVDLITQKKVVRNDFLYVLNEKEKTAGVLSAIIDKEVFFIPRSIEFESNEYLITIIYEGSFKKLMHFKTIQFPEDSELRIIDKNSFLNTTIESIKIPRRVTVIGKNAFQNCENLFNFEISENSELKTIEKRAFLGTALDMIMIPSSLENLNKRWNIGLFYLNEIHVKLNGKQNFVFFDNKYLLGKSEPEADDFDVLLFARRDINHVIIPPFIKRISQFAFNQCEFIESIEFCEDSQLEVIDNFAFDHSSISEIVIPSTVVRIGSFAFSFCLNLSKIHFLNDSKLRTIGNEAFSNSSIKSLTLPPNLFELRTGWCFLTQKLTNITMYPNSKNYFYLDDKFVIGKLDPKSDDYNVLFFARRDIEVAIIPSFIKRIASFAFYGCDKLCKIEFTENSQMETISHLAFASSSIESIKIPNHVNFISYRCFEQCKKLKRIEFSMSSELKLIESLAFSDTKLETLCIPSSVVDLKKGWCNGMPKLKHIRIMDGNSRYTYYDDKYLLGKTDTNSDNFDDLLFVRRDLDVAVIPSFVKQIEYSAFNKCKRLREVIFEENSQLNTIKSHSLWNCALERIVIPRNVIEIKSDTFVDCKNLQRVEFANNSKLRFIGDNAFQITSIVSFVIPASVIEIGDDIFTSCPNLQIVEIEENSKLRRVGKNDFICPSLKNFMVPNNLWKLFYPSI